MTALIWSNRRDPKISGATWLRSISIGILLAGLAGCAAAPPPVTYDLNAIEPVMAAAPASRAAHGALAVATPKATSLVDSQRIVVRTGPDLAYLKGAQWAGRLPELIQTRLIESFERSHRLAVVGASAPAAKYTLETDIRRFEADVTRSVAMVEIYARLVGAGGQIIYAQNFTAEAPAPHDDGATVSAALDQALAKVLHQIVTWTVPKV